MTDNQAYWEHYQMRFWLWACLEDGQSFLDAHVALMALPAHRWSDYMILHDRQTLAKYHFVAGIGSLMRALQRAQKRFPELEPIVLGATHLIAEGRDLRNKLEHSDEYIAGETKRPGFVRQGPEVELPGDEPGYADATSIVGDSRGIWLGGRLNVQWAMAEIAQIKKVADEIPVPRSSSP